MKVKNFPNVPELLNEIQQLPENSLIEKILSWCEETNTDPKELGDYLEENEQFKRMLWLNAVEHNQIRDVQLKDRWKQMNELDDW
jgi:hypothetical protein